MGFMSNNKTTKHNFVHFVLNNKIEQNAILTLSDLGEGGGGVMSAHSR